MNETQVSEESQMLVWHSIKEDVVRQRFSLEIHGCPVTRVCDTNDRLGLR